MLPFIEIKAERIMVAPEQVLLRSADYQRYLSADELLEVARQRAEDIEQGAQDIYEQQKQLGWLAGMEHARQQQAVLIQETLLQCNDYYRRVEEQMSEVVLQAVRKIIRQYDATELTLQVTREALSLVSNQKQVILHVEPDRVSDVREQISRVLKDFPEVGYVDVIADARLGQGGCMLETEVGMIDASIDGQLIALQTALKQQWAQRELSVEPGDNSSVATA